MYYVYIHVLHVASPSTCPFVYLAGVLHLSWEEGDVEEGGVVAPLCSSFGDRRVGAHETAGVLQKPIIEAPGPPPGCV